MLVVPKLPIIPMENPSEEKPPIIPRKSSNLNIDISRITTTFQDNNSPKKKESNDSPKLPSPIKKLIKAGELFVDLKKFSDKKNWPQAFLQRIPQAPEILNQIEAEKEWSKEVNKDLKHLLLNLYYKELENLELIFLNKESDLDPEMAQIKHKLISNIEDKNRIDSILKNIFSNLKEDVSSMGNKVLDKIAKNFKLDKNHLQQMMAVGDVPIIEINDVHTIDIIDKEIEDALIRGSISFYTHKNELFYGSPDNIFKQDKTEDNLSSEEIIATTDKKNANEIFIRDFRCWVFRFFSICLEREDNLSDQTSDPKSFIKDHFDSSELTKKNLAQCLLLFYRSLHPEFMRDKFSIFLSKYIFPQDQTKFSLLLLPPKKNEILIKMIKKSSGPGIEFQWICHKSLHAHCSIKRVLAMRIMFDPKISWNITESFRYRISPFATEEDKKTIASLLQRLKHFLKIMDSPLEEELCHPDFDIISLASNTTCVLSDSQKKLQPFEEGR